MSPADIAVIVCAALALVSARVAWVGMRTAANAATSAVNALETYIETRREHDDFDRRSLACWLKINAATNEQRPVADWAWAWAHGIDEDD